MKAAALFATFAAVAVAEKHCTGTCLGGDPNSLMGEVRVQKEAQWKVAEAEGRLPQNVTSVMGQKSKMTCNDGSITAANGLTYGCSNVDLDSFMSLADLSTGITGSFTYTSDIWGWRSDEGTEITILCMNNAVTFIDSTNPVSPVHVATMMSVGSRSASWCDIKVHKDTAYVVKDSAPQQGIQVFDMKRLATEGSYSGSPPNLSPDFQYNEHGSSHNLVVDTESEFLYSVGSNTCRGGLHMVDISEPLNPQFAGCAGADGYIHDAQCVVYTGPDTRYTGREICFGFNENTMTIYDVTDKANPEILSREGYSGSAYTHQGWLNADMTSVLLNDELDEQRGTTDNRRTRTYVWDVTALDKPFETGRFDHPEQSVDHNLYMWGAIHRNGWGGNPAIPNTDISDSYAYLSNYCSGLQIVNLDSMTSGVISTAGFFDTEPTCSRAIFEGTWSNYMHPSGVIANSNIGSGVYFLESSLTMN
jgi:choice-of-anchor B domain-containing protein